MNCCKGKHVLGILFFIVLFCATCFFVPWRLVHWGTLSFIPGSTVTVTGEAKTKQTNQIATFTAGVSSMKDNKQDATDEVNRIIGAITDAVKAFGIPVADIKTQSINIYQEEETYYEGSIQKRRPGQWRVSNTIEIILRTVNRAGELTDAVSKAGATNVYGPNFSMDETGETENSLLAEAVVNARKKVDLIAKGSGKKVGDIISITETGSTSLPRPFMADVGGGGGMEPGTATITKNVTVTFELLE